MTRNLKALGLALVAVFAMSALAAQGASAAVEHEFHADAETAVVTGAGENHEFTVGTKGIVKCKKVQTESTQTGALVSAGTYAADTITVIPHYTECEFGSNPATVNFHHCAYVFDSDTTLGNPTEFPKEGGGTTKEEHANVEIECEGPENAITIATNTCTLTVGPQLIKHGVRYANDAKNKNAVEVIATAHEVVIGNLNDKAGCVLFPKGAVGKYIGTTTGTCYRDDGAPITEKTAKTTPTGTTKEGPETECKVSNL